MKKRFQHLIKLGIFASILMYFINKSIESYALVRNLLHSHDDDFFLWKGHKIFYQKTGKGSPLLLIHDLNPASSSQEWCEVVDKLSQSYTVYTLDLLGCGRSDKPNMTYTNYYYVMLITDFAKEIIGEKTKVMSTGKSGSFTVLAANMNPELFGDITLVNPESLGKLEVQPDRRSKILKFVMDLPILGNSVYYLMTSETQIEFDFSEKYFYNPFHVNSKLMHTYYESAHIKQGGGRHLMASLNGCYVNNTIRFALPNIQQDIQLIFGEYVDNAENIAASYQKYNEFLTYGFVEKTKMLPQLEAPDDFISVFN